MPPRPQFADAALALGVVALEFARIPMHAAERLPGMGRMSAEGAAIRARARSRLEGLLDDLLHAPEAERAIERVLSSTLPEAIVRAVIEHHVAERVAVELETVDVDSLVVTASIVRSG
jgi:hypothetical protein